MRTLILIIALVCLAATPTPYPSATPPVLKLDQIVLVVMPDGSCFSGRVEEISPSGGWIKVRDEMPSRDQNDLRWVPSSAVKEQLQPRT